MAQNKLTIFSLPPELRDEIWLLIVTHDMDLVTGRHTPLDIYKTPKRERPRLISLFSLIAVSKAVRREVTAILRGRYTFHFQTSRHFDRLVGSGGSNWGYHSPCPAVLFKMGHVSIFPNGPIDAHRQDDSFHHPWRFHSPPLGKGKKRKTHKSEAHPPGWKTLDPSAEQVMRSLLKRPLKLRSLEMSAIVLFSIRVVRQLRNLRGVDLRFAFIPDEVELPRRVLAYEDEEYPVKRLAEPADTHIVLPIYRTETDTEPVSIAPLSCLVDAIRREAASSKPMLSRAVYLDHEFADPAFWIDFDDASLAATKAVIASHPKASLSQPTSGWYRYSTRIPGVACLEMAQEPFPHEQLKRKMRKRQRREWGKRDLPSRWYPDHGLGRTRDLDGPRAASIYHLGLQKIVVAQRGKSR